MREQLEVMMRDFKPEDYSVRLVSNLFHVVPYGPNFDFYSSLQDVVRVNAASLGPAQLNRIQQLATSEDVENALWVAEAMNTGGKGIAVFTGIKSAYNMFFNSNTTASTFDTDPEQAADAALKAMGMAYMIHKLFPGTVMQKVEGFKALKAGEGMALYFAAMEVALPFTDVVLRTGGRVVSNLLSRPGSDHAARFAQLTGGAGVQESTGILNHFGGTLEKLVVSVNQHVTPIANMAKQHLPGVLDTVGKVTSAAATAADLLPIWRLLGSRLAAEAVVFRALRGD